MSDIAASGGVSWARVRVPNLLSLIGKALFVLGQLGTLASVLGLPVLSLFALPGMLAYPAFIVSYIMSLTQTPVGGGIEIIGPELVIHTSGKRSVVPLTHVAGALVVEREMFGAFVPTVEIEMKDGDRLTLNLRDPMQARSIVAALGFGPGGRRIRTTLMKPTRRLLHPALALVGYMLGAGFLGATVALTDRSIGASYGVAFFLYPLLALGVFTLLKRLTRAPVTTVGEDGVAVEQRFGTRFVARRDLQQVDHALDSPLVLYLRDGSRTSIASLALDHARVAAVARAIEERSPPDAASPDRIAHYGRSGLAIADWRVHLERGLKQAGYRATAATADEALAVLRSPGATAEQRVGAALAARVAGIPPERIRIAAEATADERVRIALEAVADDREDAVIEKAMRRVQG